MIRPTTLLALCCFVTVACDRDDQTIRVYKTPKESPPPAVQTAPTAPADDRIGWTVPQGWRELPSSQMRFATFQVSPQQPNVVLTVIPLGLEAGRLLPNINRWERQLGLPPSGEQDLPRVVKRIEAAGHVIDMIDLTGPESGDPPQRMLAAIISHGQRVWFFKLQGLAAVIARQQPAFERFVRSVYFADESREPNPQ